MKIIIETIPHKEQRYDTVGDWYWVKEPIVDHGDGGPGPTTEIVGYKQVLYIKVSKGQSQKGEHLIAIHELVEALLCLHDGVTQQQVDQFDMKEFPAKKLLDEPGDHPDAPYKKQHCIATGIERILSAHLGIDWCSETP